MLRILNKVHVLCCTLITIILTACSPAPAQLPDDVFVQEVALRGQLGGADAFGVLVEIESIGDLLAVFDRKPLGGSEQVLLVDRNSGRIIKRVGAPGQGPGEIGTSLSIANVPGEAAQFSVFDIMGRRISVFDYSGDEVEPVRNLNYPDGGIVIQAAWLGEDKAVLSGEFKDHWLRFLSVDASSDSAVEVNRVGTPPDRILVPQAALMWNWTTMTVSPDRQNIALAFVYPSRLLILDSNGDLRAEAAIPIKVEPQIEFDGVLVRPDKDAGARLSYVDVTSTDQYVLALFSGTPEPDWGEAQQIHVFTWSGELVGVFRLEQPIHGFTVDPQTHQMYGIRASPVSMILEFGVLDFASLEIGRATKSFNGDQ